MDKKTSECQVIVVTSGNEVGKTTTVANVSTSLARMECGLR